jgi:hypothetical protein
MVGFMDGPQGIYNGEYCIVDDKLMDQYRNAGGFDMIGSGRHKIEKPAEFASAMENCIKLDLDGTALCLTIHYVEPSTSSTTSYKKPNMIQSNNLNKWNLLT